MTQRPLIFPNVFSRYLGVSMSHLVRKGQTGKERLLSLGGTAGCGQAGMGRVKGVISMRLEDVDFSNLDGLCLWCLKGSFETLQIARAKHIASLLSWPLDWQRRVF